MGTPKRKNTHKSLDKPSVHDLGRIFKLIFSCSTRNQQIQADMTYRAMELLNLPPDEPAFLLDIGCGSGLSGEILDEEGYIWAGVDVAPSMLGKWVFSRIRFYCLIIGAEVALEREVEGDLFLQDIGQGFGFRPGSFDGAIRSADRCHHLIMLSILTTVYRSCNG